MSIDRRNILPIWKRRMYDLRNKHAISLMLLMLFFGSFFLGSQTNPVPLNENAVSESSNLTKTGFTTAATQAAEDSLNVANKNWDFEIADPNGGPANWSYSSTGYIRSNDTYQDLTHLGSYSGRIKAQGTHTLSVSPSIRQFFSGSDRAYILEQPVLEFYWNALTNPDLSVGGSIYVQVSFTNGSTYTLYYYLSVGTTYYSNTTGRTSFILNESLAQWNFFQRNLLNDFNDRPGWSAAGNLYLSNIYFYLISPQESTAPAELVFDDVAIVNSTAYDYLQNRNGNFEMGNGAYWSDSGNYDPSTVLLTDEHTHGSKALNLTTGSRITNSQSESRLTFNLGYPVGPIPNSPTMLLLDFDWMYDDTYNGGDQGAYVDIYFTNDTYWSYVRFYLGQNMNNSIPSNYTGSGYSYYRLYADGFGSRGEWNHFFLDLFDIATAFNLRDIGVYSIDLVTYSQGFSNASTQLLADSYRIITYGVNFHDFESESDGRLPGYPIPGWSTWTGIASYFNRTPDSHSGNWAVNITPAPGVAGAIYQDSRFQVDSSSLLSFWWRLDEFISSYSTLSYLRLDLNPYSIYYVVAIDSDYTVSNSTSIGWYLLPELNTTGTWVNTVRNISSDFQALFGSAATEMNRIILYTYAEPTGNISVLFDDINIFDVIPPTGIPSVGGTPVYHAPTTIVVNADDNRAGVKEVIVSYNTGAGWQNVTASYAFTYYEASIPVLPWNTTVEYYAIITDYAGNTIVSDNGGSYYSFTVGDDILPDVDLIAPSNATTAFDMIQINASASDLGSGIERVEFFVDSLSIANVTSAPYSINWDSRMVSNGTHTLKVMAYDNQGLVGEDSITIDVQNDVSAPATYALMFNPSQPLYDMPTVVTLTALDVSGVKNVTLFYAVEDATPSFALSQDWVSVPMTAEGPVYSATIPAQEYGKTILYYVVAYDIYDQATFIGTELDPLSVDVGDASNPSLTIGGPASGSTVKGTVNFSILASDLGSGVYQVRYYVDNSLVASLNEASGSIQWDTTQHENGVYQVRFEVEDNAGNIHTVDMEYTVTNPDAFGTIGDSLSNIMSSYGFFVGAGTMLGVFIVGKIIMNRRAAASGAKATRKKKK